MSKDLTTLEYEPIQPEGLALGLMWVTIVFTVLSSVVVLLRFYVRIKQSMFGVEDWLMLFGWIINIGHNAAVLVLSVSGIGSHDNVITAGMQIKMGLWTMIWQFLYVLDGALIKSSIIWTLLRLAKGLNPMYKYALWALFGFTWAVWQISWPVAIFQCKPVSAAWGEPGDCLSGQKVILRVSYFVSAANIFTDLATSLIPAFLLRHVQIPKKLKILTMGILSLGLLASVATTIRITYTWAYTAPVDRFYTIGLIVMLTVLECDLGIIAGSMPMLRRFFRRWDPSRYGASDRTPERSADINLVTIGGGRGTHMKLRNTNNSRKDSYFDQTQDKDVHDDASSSRHIIHVTREVQQDNASARGVDDNGYEATAVSKMRS
ncbi:hypothetical protein HJFPF1_10929 [Paramyrothecium foliicola]|nr:hypothetical protein HJFPF1_10929 [Paramyrothecium foliicola]